MSFATKSFIDKIQEFKDIGSAVVLWVDVSLVLATVLVCLVAGALVGRAHIFFLLVT